MKRHHLQEGGRRAREAPERGRGNTRKISKIDEDKDALSPRTVKRKCFRGEESIVERVGGVWGGIKIQMTVRVSSSPPHGLLHSLLVFEVAASGGT